MQGPCARASGFSKTLIEALAPNYTVYHFCIKAKNMALAYIRGPCNSFCGPCTSSRGPCTGPCTRKMSLFGRLSGTKYLLHCKLAYDLIFHYKFSLCSSGSSSSDNITVSGTNSSSTNTELISDNLTRNPTVQAQQPNNGSQQLWPNANEGSSNSFSTVIHTGMDFFHQTAAASSDVVQPQLPHQPFQVAT